MNSQVPAQEEHTSRPASFRRAVSHWAALARSGWCSFSELMLCMSTRSHRSLLYLGALAFRSVCTCSREAEMNGSRMLPISMGSMVGERLSVNAEIVNFIYLFSQLTSIMRDEVTSTPD